MKKITVAAAVAVVAGALALGFWWFSRRDNRDDGALVLQGNVEIRQVSLAFEGSGRVLDVRAEEGDRVDAGDVLATLDTRSLQLQAAQAKAQGEAQRQVVDRLRSGSRPEEIAQARSALAAAQAEAAQATQDLRRLEGVSAATGGRGVSAREVARATAAAKVAAAAVEQRRQQLELAEQGPREEEVAAAEAQWKASEAHLDLLEYQIAQGELKAPVDAVVRSRLVEIGDMVAPQRAAFALALTRPKWVRVYASEIELGRIRPGMSAQVRTDSQPDQPLRGRVGFISSVAEFTPKSVQTEELRTSLVYEVRVVVEDDADRLRLGQPVTVVLATGRRQ